MKASIKEQLKLIYDGDPWYENAIKPVLESVNPALVFDLSGKKMHSIAELVTHMITWREFAERRLRGETESIPNQEQTFDWKKFSSDKKRVWSILKNRLDSSQKHLPELINQMDDSILNQRVAGKPYIFRYLLMGIVHHDLYHLGQIIYIQKLLNKESKPPDRGILRYSYRVFHYKAMTLMK